MSAALTSLVSSASSMLLSRVPASHGGAIAAASNALFTRGLRSGASGYRSECVTTSEDGAVIVCWHPEPKFPYEHTRPIPRQAEVDTPGK